MSDKIDNRRGVALRPLDGTEKTPPGFALLAIMDEPRPGWLARANQTGALVCWTGAAIASVDQRKARHALETLGAEAAGPEPEEMAAALRAWRGETSLHAAAARLGIPARTLEGIEQGRGFRYPRLLMLAIGQIK